MHNCRRDGHELNAVGACKACGSPRREVRLNEELELHESSGPVKVKEVGYGFVVEDDSLEWAIVAQWTARQDGLVSYLVALTSVDDAVRVDCGLVPWAEAKDRIESGIRMVTVMAGWAYPINL